MAGLLLRRGPFGAAFRPRCPYKTSNALRSAALSAIRRWISAASSCSTIAVAEFALVTMPQVSRGAKSEVVLDSYEIAILG